MLKYSNCEQLKADNYIKAQKGEAGKVETLTFDFIGGKDVMPIGGWWGPYQPKNPVCDLSDIRFYELIKEAGVNFIVVSPDNYQENPQAALKGFKNATETGLGMFAHDTKIKEIDNPEELRQRLEEYNHFPCCLGFHLQDEPAPGAINQLTKYFDVYEQVGIDKPLYVNLYAAGIHEFFGNDGEAQGYAEYLEEFFETTKPQFLSNDFYPFSFKDEGTNTAKIYFKSLSLTRKHAMMHNVPYWFFIQAGWWEKGGETDEERWPTKSELFWNVNTCLAYGAKAIQYFTLVQPEEYTVFHDVINYRKIGIIGFDGQKNQWYPYVQQINQHIAAIDHVLMNSEHDGVIGVGKWSENWLGEEKLASYKELVGVSGGDAIIGCFNYQGSTALYIVSNSTTNESTVTLTFDCVRGFEIIDDGKSLELVGQNPSFVLEAGAGFLLLLK